MSKKKNKDTSKIEVDFDLDKDNPYVELPAELKEAGFSKDDVMVSEEDVEKLLKWMLGLAEEPPASIQKMLVNLTKKLNVAMAQVVTMNVSRLYKLTNFVTKAEMTLFDDKNILEGDKETLNEHYVKAENSLRSTLDFVRKFIIQNKETLEEAGKEVDELKDLLLRLSPEKLKEIEEKIKKDEI